MARSHLLRKKARTILITWLVVFVGAQLALALALESPLAILRNPDYAKRRDILRDRINETTQPVVIVLGTSRTMNGLRPDMLNSAANGGKERPFVFNFGLPGHGVMHQYLALKRLLNDGFHPQGLVVEIVPALLGWDPNELDNIPLSWYSWNDLHEVMNLKKGGDQIMRDWVEARSVPCYTYRWTIMDKMLPVWQPASRRFDYWWRDLDCWGWLRRLEKKHSSRAIDSARHMFQAGVQNLRIAPTHRLAMLKILETCERERIPVAILLMPEGPEFRSWYSQMARDHLKEFFDELKRDFRVPVVDAREWLNSEEYFIDSHHLLSAGADAFTKRFAVEVLPLVQAGHDQPLAAIAK